ncbi:hypothetical protein BATDEDRAFT_85591 [Batrachochytrium dendrobatidis JAM81]|uniref:Protein kinase domain-containing protein n=1 Tax=Batrachochytrium dendrobatidis (strain JAM81 / FGSC 10211) TaxID=684364 RepID=F4NSH4_BATDJ|nr:uncharacterized protein BATDEDRAFT_85591 [Batrachochytrium dendrobatidis JAM81]EGF83819.1 hypothetical protein BATDEDRAFT_85591 [Batrachochytrium dendrobatidis JAM81]|eukprot:XP_006676235.1 hypothetical protein BATDEDRAFT_85591 [Batrachochytrium dendrobatidis JAM81]
MHELDLITGGIPCIEDCSYNGTIVNGNKICKRMIPLPDRAEIEIKWDLYFVFINAKCRDQTLLQSITDRYCVFETQVLGQGTFAIVKMAIDLHTLERVACKIIDTKRIQLNKRGTSDLEASLAVAQQEVSVLRLVEHPNIVSIKDVVVSHENNAVYIFLTRISGGELFDHIVNSEGIEESEAKFIFYQLLLAVKYLHDHNICHRDLKAENILLESSKPFSRLLISDFGMAKALQNSLQQMQTKCGTFTYLAPEILDSPGGYSYQVDCWALGVLLFTMLAGALPFGTDADHAILIDRIRRVEYSFEDDPWPSISNDAKSMVSALLQADASKRLDVTQALNHPWIIGHSEILAKLYAKMLKKAGMENNGIPIV